MRERLQVIEATRRRLHRRFDDVFKLMVRRRAVEGSAVARTRCGAFEHTPGTWAAPALRQRRAPRVHGHRRPRLRHGTLARAQSDRALAVRDSRSAWQRRRGPAVRRLAALCPGGRSSTSTTTGRPARRRSVAQTPVRDAGDGAGRRTAARPTPPSPGRSLDPLRPGGPRPSRLGAKFDRHALERRRAAAQALAGERLVGAAICNAGASGTNRSSRARSRAFEISSTRPIEARGGRRSAPWSRPLSSTSVTTAGHSWTVARPGYVALARTRPATTLPKQHVLSSPAATVRRASRRPTPASVQAHVVAACWRRWETDREPPAAVAPTSWLRSEQDGPALLVRPSLTGPALFGGSFVDFGCASVR